MNDQGENHTSVGAALFEYCHTRGGTRSRYGFEMRVGDNPDFWKARLLMPGAEFQGICYASWDSRTTDTGAILSTSQDRPFYALLTAGRSTFRIELMAADHADFLRRCREIGALQTGLEPLSRWTRFLAVLRFLWLRRPTIRLRSPLSIFDR